MDESKVSQHLPRRALYRCPHCHARGRVRSSRVLSPLYREQTVQCMNAECGHTYVVGVEVLRTISPSATPDPNVRLAQSGRPDTGIKRAVNH